jgi:hypothetical protein
VWTIDASDEEKAIAETGRNGDVTSVSRSRSSRTNDRFGEEESILSSSANIGTNAGLVAMTLHLSEKAATQ